MKAYITVFSLATLLVASTFSPVLAQTYGYINTNGELRAEEADSPQEAILEAPDRAPHSGVMLISEPIAVGVSEVDTNTETYGYIDTSGDLALQVAETPQEAILEAPDRAPDSGVMLIVE